MPDESQQVSACPACGYEHDPGDTCIQPYQRWDELVGAVKDVCWKATPMYLPDGEDVNYYMVPKGSLHRLVGIGQRFGSVALRNGERDAAVKATLDAGKPEDAELIATNQLLRAALRVAYDDMEAMYQAVASVPRRHVTVVEDSWEKGRVLLMPDQSNRAEVSEIGWAVLTDSADGGWDLNWDGELFTDIAKAQDSAGEAVRSGWKTALAKLTIVETYAEQIKDHEWVGIAGHPDDTECSKCGEPEDDHAESSR